MSLVKRLRDRTHVSQQFEDEAANRIEELEKDWISVEDRRPEIPCLTHWDDGSIEAYNKVEFADGSLVLDDLLDPAIDARLTHWMPLPSPPEQDND